MRNKLIELLRKATIEVDEGYPMSHYKCRAVSDEVAERLADRLIANGVTIGDVPESNVGEWIPVSERLPERNGKYLTCEKLGGRQCIDILDFATDLYEIDDYDFADKKGESGFLYWDSECGYCEIDVVTHWMPLPEPPKGE